MFDKIRTALVTVVAVALCMFTLTEVNFPLMQQTVSGRAMFALLGLVICFLALPLSRRLADTRWSRTLDAVLAILAVVCCGYVVIQNEQMFRAFWIDGQSLGDRAGAVSDSDMVIGLIGLLIVLEATRRSIGWIVPVLALAFVGHSWYCHLSQVYRIPQLPDWMLPHSGEDLRGLSKTTFLDGVFGIPLGVMFKYVFLFVIFGAFLEISGATRFVIDTTRRLFARVTGGPALVSVVSSGLLGSLSGSAVANSMLSGNFTIPMMRQSGLNRETAAGIEAAASTGGALVPPVMGAGAYMMLDLVDPPVTYLQIVRAAIVPACLYYFSLLVIVWLYARRIGARSGTGDTSRQQPASRMDGLIFVASLAMLVMLLLMGYTPFRAVTGSLVVILLLACFRQRTGDDRPVPRAARIAMLAAMLVGGLVYAAWCAGLTDTFENPLSGRQWFDFLLEASIAGMLVSLALGLVMECLAGFMQPDWQPVLLDAFRRSALNGVSLIAASACVGIIIGVVQQTGIASDFGSVIKDVVEQNLLLALVGIMVCSIVLGMGVPSVVCYLLVATLMATLLGDMGVIPLGAHLFIFYFGMMSMVTPPVALAAYATSSIAGAKIMKTALVAFRFALVGFTLPYMFVYRPALMLMDGAAWQQWMDASANSPEKAEYLQIAHAAWPSLPEVVIALAAAVTGIVALAAAIAGYLRGPMSMTWRIVSFVAAAALLLPEIQVSGQDIGWWVNLGGGLLFVVVVILGRSVSQPAEPDAPLPGDAT